MENCSMQMSKKNGGEEEKKAAVLEGLPMETSPYLNYTDLEDYKRKAYGTEGHMQVKPNQGGGATDAPTLSGNAVSDKKAASVRQVTP